MAKRSLILMTKEKEKPPFDSEPSTLEQECDNCETIWYGDIEECPECTKVSECPA